MSGTRYILRILGEKKIAPWEKFLTQRQGLGGRGQKSIVLDIDHFDKDPDTSSDFNIDTNPDPIAWEVHKLNYI